ncbi:MAG TPA: DNA alkylation repair protein [Chryseosolibacter sp.]
MKINPHHAAILGEIQAKSGVATSHTFLDSYLGNSHPRYAINAPKLREIARSWARNNKALSATEFCKVVDSLIHGESSTEKVIGGMIMDYATKEQIQFDPKIFDSWIEQLEGWAEVDAVCTGQYTINALPLQWSKWEKILKRFAKSKNIHKRRASLVLLCSPVRYCQEESMAAMAFANIEALKHEREVLITKAISWLLRSMIKNFKKEVSEYVSKNKDSLPSIAVRETLVTLKTGKKTK